MGGVHEQLGRRQATAVVEVACAASEDHTLVAAFRAAAASLKQVPAAWLLLTLPW